MLPCILSYDSVGMTDVPNGMAETKLFKITNTATVNSNIKGLIMPDSHHCRNKILQKNKISVTMNSALMILACVPVLHGQGPATVVL